MNIRSPQILIDYHRLFDRERNLKELEEIATTINMELLVS